MNNANIKMPRAAKMPKRYIIHLLSNSLKKEEITTAVSIYFDTSKH